MKKVKWLAKEPTLIRVLPGGEKVDLKHNQVIEVEASIAEALVNAYAQLVFVDEPIEKAKKKDPVADKEAKVETQDVKKEDVQKA